MRGIVFTFVVTALALNTVLGIANTTGQLDLESIAIGFGMSFTFLGIALILTIQERS